jgi:hypothetical protein
MIHTKFSDFHVYFGGGSGSGSGWVVNGEVNSRIV